jgi:hypothetical protein
MESKAFVRFKLGAALLVVDCLTLILGFSMASPPYSPGARLAVVAGAA